MPQAAGSSNLGASENWVELRSGVTQTRRISVLPGVEEVGGADNAEEEVGEFMLNLSAAA